MAKHFKSHKFLAFTVLCGIGFFLFQSVLHISKVIASEKTVSIIRSNRITAYDEAIEGFKEGCERKSISTKEVYDLNGDIEEGIKVIRNIKADKQRPDLILAVGILAATLARKQFTDIPIIFCMVVYHERFNLRGPNISGISTEVPLKEQFVVLKKILGKKKNVGVIYNPFYIENVEKIISEVVRVTKQFELNLIARKVRTKREIISALKEIVKKIDVLWIIPDASIMTEDMLSEILKTAMKHRLPTFCNSKAFVKSGALVSVSPDYKHIGYQAARMAQTLLNSPTVVSLGIKQPEQINVFLNTLTATSIGVNICQLKTCTNTTLYP